MRIDEILIENFKQFERQQFSLHPQFTLFAGENGAGKTTILDALAVALGIWLVDVPDSRIFVRNILQGEIRLVPERRTDRIQFQEMRPVRITATGFVDGMTGRQTWTRQIREAGTRTTNADARHVQIELKKQYDADKRGERIVFPIIAYYGAGRAWLPSNAQSRGGTDGPARRWNAFYDCLFERIRFTDLREWFKREAIAAAERGGRMRPGFEVVKLAVLNCVPGATGLRFDSDLDEPVLSLDGQDCPLSNLSAGQRMMFALVADLAIKTVTQNAILLEEIPANERGPSPTTETPGVVLIDELDVHLHPLWQRRVATDLKRTFPKIQFVCTSHSPQVIGELNRDEVRLLRKGEAYEPEFAYGSDANWLLDHVMGAASRNAEVSEQIHVAEDAIDVGDFDTAEAQIETLRKRLGSADGELTRLDSGLQTLKALAQDPLEPDNHADDQKAA